MHTAKVRLDSIERVNPVFPTFRPACENLERIGLIVRAARSLDGVAHTDIVIPIREVRRRVRDRSDCGLHMRQARRNERRLIDRLPLDRLLRCLVRVDDLAAHHLQRLRQISKELFDAFSRDQLQPSRATYLQVHIKAVWFLGDRMDTANDVLLSVP